ncbi:hypothetical protein [Lutibacter flavus]|uniref:Uncharacterized protein n=1 Tax=Lutibacter flavus TaxID=691689 RepID=A0A238Y5H1_9FLAO|nr:hypothetical protein [Lutibacter flavus]SNR66455.1 hypothetical protein SAMN04488111_2307 [Lutibacter flavus]
MKNYYLRIPILFIVSILFSCSDNEGTESTENKKEYLITQVSSIDHTQIDFDGVDNTWDYEYDENQKLISVTQYNPRDTYYKIENRLIYDSNGMLERIKVVKNTAQHQDEYLITHEEGKVSLYNFGADIKNYYYDLDGFITKTEDVFIGFNTNFSNYLLNNEDQLAKVESGVDGEVMYTRLFMDFDKSKPFQFHYVFPTEDFIIMYAFNLKFNGLGKPSTWDYGYFEYDVDNNGNVSELKTFSDVDNITEYDGGYRFKYVEK